MRIRMLVDFPVSVSGYRVEVWEEDGVYDAPEELAQALIRDGHARFDDFVLPPIEIKPAPEAKRRKAR